MPNQGKLVFYNVAALLIALSFYPLGRAIPGYQEWSVQFGIGLVLIVAGLVVLGVRVVRGNSQAATSVGGIALRLVTYAEILLLGLYAGMVDLTVGNGLTNPFVSAFVIALIVFLANFVEDGSVFFDRLSRDRKQAT
ncbi:MAG TPA: hypothetical protein VHD55_03745 [Candidatus Paceibacterota bacterium]|nr:hypothetical protein [Candidatus Paceibacterota bacterium]